MLKSKGQTEVVSAILLTGIMVSLVVATYFWGLPIIQKQKDRSRLDTMESFMKNLNSAIKEVANEGGRRKLSREIPGELRFVSKGGDPFEDNITLTFQSQGSLIATNETIHLVGDDRTQVPVSGESGVLTVRSEPLDGQYEITMNLRYRNLTSGDKVYRIDLNNVGRSSISDREVTITIERGSASPSGNFYPNRINIRFQ